MRNTTGRNTTATIKSEGNMNEKLLLIKKKIKWCEVQLIHATRFQNWPEVERVKSEKQALEKQREELNNGVEKSSS